MKKDLLRDLKRPWGTLILLAIPIAMGAMMGMVFNPNNGAEQNIVIHLAILDQDDDFFSHMLRSMGSQDDPANQLRLYFVDTIEEGVSLIEQRKVSALVVLPENMTANLIDGATCEIQLYPNPAENILPKIVKQGTELLAAGLSQAVDLIGPELKQISKFVDQDEFPSSLAVSVMAYQTMERIKNVKQYLIPPILTFSNIEADAYIPSVSQTIQVNQPEEGGS